MIFVGSTKPSAMLASSSTIAPSLAKSGDCMAFAAPTSETINRSVCR
jgi:hypothetical protein